MAKNFNASDIRAGFAVIQQEIKVIQGLCERLLDGHTLDPESEAFLAEMVEFVVSYSERRYGIPGDPKVVGLVGVVFTEYLKKGIQAGLSKIQNNGERN